MPVTLKKMKTQMNANKRKYNNKKSNAFICVYLRSFAFSCSLFLESQQ